MPGFTFTSCHKAFNYSKPNIEFCKSFAEQRADTARKALACGESENERGNESAESRLLLYTCASRERGTTSAVRGEPNVWETWSKIAQRARATAKPSVCVCERECVCVSACVRARAVRVRRTVLHARVCVCVCALKWQQINTVRRLSRVAFVVVVVGSSVHASWIYSRALALSLHTICLWRSSGFFLSPHTHSLPLSISLSLTLSLCG